MEAGAHKKRLRLFGGRRRKKDCLILHQLLNDYHRNMLPPEVIRLNGNKGFTEDRTKSDFPFLLGLVAALNKAQSYGALSPKQQDSGRSLPLKPAKDPSVSVLVEENR